MDQIVLYPLGTGESCRYAAQQLEQAGIRLTDHPSPEITHLLLDFSQHDQAQLRSELRMLPQHMVIISGRLEEPFLEPYRKIELLKDETFLAQNAAITADCALRAAAPHLKTIWADSPTLILGWGRIGKCLAALLKGMGCPVTVAARKEADRAVLTTLGYRAVDFPEVTKAARKHRILFNTVPGIRLPEDTTQGCILLDLASLPGLQGPAAIPARGLPGKFAPESAGRLIAETILRKLQEEKL